MKKSFKNELFISFLAVALISIAASGILMTSSLRSKMEYDYRKEAMLQLEEISSALTNHTEELKMIMESAMDNQRIIAPLYEDDSWIRKKAYNSLYELTDEKREFASFYLYNGEGECILSTAETTTKTDIVRPTYWGLLKTARTHPEEIIIKNAYYDEVSSDAILAFAKAILSGDDCIGYIVAEMSADNMDLLISDLYTDDSEVVIMDEFWDEIYCSKSAKNSKLASFLHDNRFEGIAFENPEDRIIFEIMEMPKEGLCIAIGKQTSFTGTLIRTMITVMLITAGISFVLCFIIAHILSRHLMQPINNMTRAMEQVRGGDLTVRMGSKRQDEFGQLSRDFDDMTNALKVYVELRSKQQQELSDSNIAMMQAQLNPHFLYNTLDTIKWVAKANHIPELATLSASLAQILRASISPDIFVPLAKEMDFIDHYIEIQKIRFPENFTFDAEVPLELEDAIVPKLILQPIVENAIVHGLKDREHGHIFLNAYERAGRLVIYVEDDGCGMDDEMLKVLNTRDSKALKGHIGFYNVDAIIRLHYGLNYGLRAENVKEGGARITMELPLRMSGQENN